MCNYLALVGTAFLREELGQIDQSEFVAGERRVTYSLGMIRFVNEPEALITMDQPSGHNKDNLETMKARHPFAQFLQIIFCLTE